MLRTRCTGSATLPGCHDGSISRMYCRCSPTSVSGSSSSGAIGVTMPSSAGSRSKMRSRSMSSRVTACQFGLMICGGGAAAGFSAGGGFDDGGAAGALRCELDVDEDGPGEGLGVRSRAGTRASALFSASLNVIAADDGNGDDGAPAGPSTGGVDGPAGAGVVVGCVCGCGPGAGVAAIRPRYSESPPTIAHDRSATLTHALPDLAEKRCCASHRNILAPAMQPPAPMITSASKSNRVALRPMPTTHACKAWTA